MTMALEISTPPGTNWLNVLVEFYDFIWEQGLEAHASCVNSELLLDFQNGGDKFEQMKKLIVKKFPDFQSAYIAFEKSKSNNP